MKIVTNKGVRSKPILQSKWNWRPVANLGSVVFSVLLVVAVDSDVNAAGQSTMRQCSGAWPRDRISACALLIESGQLSGTALSDAYYDRAHAERALGRYPQAISDYTKALTVTPNDPDILSDRALAESAIGEDKLSIADADEAIALYPADPLPRSIKGWALIHLGRVEEGIAALDTAIKLKPDFWLAIGQRAEALAKLGKFQDAIMAGPW